MQQLLWNCLLNKPCVLFANDPNDPNDLRRTSATQHNTDVDDFTLTFQGLCTGDEEVIINRQLDGGVMKESTSAGHHLWCASGREMAPLDDVSTIDVSRKWLTIILILNRASVYCLDCVAYIAHHGLCECRMIPFVIADTLWAVHGADSKRHYM